MATPNVRQTWFPPPDPSIPPAHQVRFDGLFRGINQHDQAITQIQSIVGTLQNTIAGLQNGTSSGTNTNITTIITEIETQFAGLGVVNHQIGTAYEVQTADGGSLIAFTSNSAITCTLNSSIATPYFVFIAAFGTGTVTLVPQTGIVHGTATVAPTSFSIVFFDGVDWWVISGSGGGGVTPDDTPAIVHKWLNSYNATTGAFGQTQPAFSDLSGQIDPSTQMPASGVTAGSYTSTNLTVDAEGRVTAAANGVSGGVTSVGLTMPAEFSVSGSPVTGSGTLAVTKANESANTAYAGPSTGSPAAPAFRALVPADLPAATSSTFGIVKPDNSSVTISGGVLSAPGGTPLFFGNASAIAGNGQNIVTLGSTPVTNAWNVFLNGVRLPLSLLSISGAVITFTGAWAAGDVISALWVTTNSTPGSITLSGSGSVIRGSVFVTSNTSSCVISFPVGTLAGDLMVISWGTTDGSETIPTGWTTLVTPITGSFWTGAVIGRTLTPTNIATGSVTLSNNSIVSGGVVFMGSPTVADAKNSQASGTSATLTTTASAAIGNTAVYFGSAKSPTSTNTVSRGTQIQSGANTVSSGVVYVETIVSTGTVSATYNYTSSATLYQSLVLLNTVAGAGGATPEINPTQIAGGIVQTITTVGSSGAAALTGSVLNIPIYGGGGLPFWPINTPPNAASWTQINFAGATVTDSGTGVVTLKASSVTTPQLLFTTLPAAPYTVTIGVIPTLNSSNFCTAGMSLQSSGGALYNFVIQWSSGPQLGVQKWNSPTSFNANGSTFVLPVLPTGPIYLQVQDDGTNRILRWSYDGINFIQFESVVRTTFLTAANVGWFAETNGATLLASISLFNWKVTTP